MKDLYKRLSIPADSPAEVIRAALPSADVDARAAAEFVLLDVRRRAVYDRNRRALVTIGRLRANLGLNYTRLWARSELKDFREDLFTPEPPRPRRRVDSVMIAQAIRTARRHGTHHAARWQSWVAVLLIATILAAAILLWRAHG